ncbi:MAG TPA: YbaK/EbsC family protein [Elusimicrobiota bacterium]|jgi:Ala-tRNA(Pro) deacylase|nr:YbaK/EbsC family protein [Elusimicrobiota bacterium]
METAGVWIRSLMQERGVPYQEVHHNPAFTAQEVAHKEHVRGAQVAKVVVVVADEHPIQLVLPAHRSVDLDGVRFALGVKSVRLASEDEMRALFPDCEVGAEPPLRHWKGVELWMDASLRSSEEILFQAGTHRDGIRMRFADWFKLAQPMVAYFAAS